ncbi:MAG: hypothetical protein JW881_05630 [Spirochaetales bacterium]|nr:hypothetical protein [Spirochaetales bacterium]
MPENLPEKPSVEHLKKQAKQLLKAFRNGDYAAFRIFRLIGRYASLPKKAFLNAPIKLHDARYAIALHYGFKSWRQLSDYCTQINKEDTMSGTIKEEFDRLKGLKNRAMQRLLRQVDSQILAMALLDADEGVKQKVFVNMSGRACTLLKSDITALTDTPEMAVTASKEKILGVYKRLVKAGEIMSEKAGKEETPVKSEPVGILKKKKSSGFTNAELKEFFYELCRKAHTKGLLQLESDAEMVDDELIKKGLELIVDGTDPSLVESILKTKLEKAIRDYRVKYESSINALLDIQKGHYPEMVRERLDASL